MAQAALKQQAPSIATDARIAVGGTVAEMQRSIEDRLLLAERQGLASPVVTAEVDVAHRLSRLAGPVLLVGAYAAVALRLF